VEISDKPPLLIEGLDKDTGSLACPIRGGEREEGEPLGWIYRANISGADISINISKCQET
jgi:hypothetical protein